MAKPSATRRPDYDPVVVMILLAERGISARYIARCLSRVRGEEVTAADVERMVFERSAARRGSKSPAR